MIHNSGNTCYLDSLLIGMFLFDSKISKILNNQINNGNCKLLQDHIRDMIVPLIRNMKHVDNNIMIKFKQLCKLNGWSTNEFNEQQDVAHFYEWLAEKLNITPIKVQIETRTVEGEYDDDNISNITPMTYIPLSIDQENDKNNISDMLYNWINNNEIEVNRKVNDRMKSVKGVSFYHFVNTPEIFTVAVNRFDRSGRIDMSVNILKKISPYTNYLHQPCNYNVLHYTKWQLHCIICHKGKTPYSGHYYTIVHQNFDNFYLYDGISSPTLKLIDMSDSYTINMIKKEAYLLIYTLC